MELRLKDVLVTNYNYLKDSYKDTGAKFSISSQYSLVQSARVSPWEAPVGVEEQLLHNAALQERGCLKGLWELPPQRFSRLGWTVVADQV